MKFKILENLVKSDKKKVGTQIKFINKIIWLFTFFHVKYIYNINVDNFFIGIISIVYWIKISLKISNSTNQFEKIKTFRFQKNYTRYEKTFWNKIVHLKKIYKFTQKNSLISHVVFIQNVKNDIKNVKFHFTPNLFGIRRKCYITKYLQI